MLPRGYAADPEVVVVVSMWYTHDEINRMRTRDRVLVQMARQSRGRPGHSGGDGGGGDGDVTTTTKRSDHRVVDEDEDEGFADSLLGLESDIAVDGSKGAAKRSRHVVFQEQERQQQQPQDQPKTSRVVTVDPVPVAVAYEATTSRAARRAQRWARGLALRIQRQSHQSDDDGREQHRQERGGGSESPLPSRSPSRSPPRPNVQRSPHSMLSKSPKRSLSPCRPTLFTTRIANGALSPQRPRSPISYASPLLS